MGDCFAFEPPPAPHEGGENETATPWRDAQRFENTAEISPPYEGGAGGGLRATTSHATAKTPRDLEIAGRFYT